MFLLRSLFSSDLIYLNGLSIIVINQFEYQFGSFFSCSSHKSPRHFLVSMKGQLFAFIFQTFFQVQPSILRPGLFPCTPIQPIDRRDGCSTPWEIFPQFFQIFRSQKTVDFDTWRFVSHFWFFFNGNFPFRKFLSFFVVEDFQRPSRGWGWHSTAKTRRTSFDTDSSLNKVRN